MLREDLLIGPKMTVSQARRLLQKPAEWATTREHRALLDEAHDVLEPCMISEEDKLHYKMHQYIRDGLLPAENITIAAVRKAMLEEEIRKATDSFLRRSNNLCIDHVESFTNPRALSHRDVLEDLIRTYLT